MVSAAWSRVCCTSAWNGNEHDLPLAAHHAIIFLSHSGDVKKGTALENDAWFEKVTRGAVVVCAGRDGSCLLRLRDGRLLEVTRLSAWRGVIRNGLSRAEALFDPQRRRFCGPLLMGGCIHARIIDPVANDGVIPLGSFVRRMKEAGSMQG
jgi:hypothetical protein